MDKNDDLTIQARVKEWDIFSPQWDYLAEMPALELGSICAMSVGLHPYFASPAWVLLVAIPHFDGTDSDEWFPIEDAEEGAELAKRLKEFLKRAHIACANLVPLGHLPIAAGEPSGEQTIVRVADFAAWAARRGWELPADFPRAEKHAEPPNGGEKQEASASSQCSKRKTQADRVQDWLTECECRAVAAGESFNRERMPGTKIEFLNLLHALDADLRSIRTAVSLDNYLKPAGCTWPNNAGAQPSAIPLYARLFPDASILAPGVTSTQHRKS